MERQSIYRNYGISSRRRRRRGTPYSPPRGGAVVVSDIVWRTVPATPLGDEWGWVAHFTPIRTEEYASLIAAAGLTVERIHVHPRSAWDEYQTPMAATADAERAAGDADFADQIMAGIALERRAVDAFFDYATFIARRP